MPAINNNSGNGSGQARSPDAVLSRENAGASPGSILIADDNQDDALHAKKIVEKLQLSHPVNVVFSGQEVIAYLEGEGRYGDRAAFPYPVLLLLDLRMPGTDGFEVLKWLQSHRDHQHLPVVVLSVVRELPMITWAYQLGARSFLIKPLTLSEIRGTLQALAVFAESDLSPA